MRKNTIQSNEFLLLTNSIFSSNYEFYDEEPKVVNLNWNPKVVSIFKKEFNFIDVYTEEYTLSATEIFHTRNIYTFFDLLGDLGGVMDIFFIVFGTMLSPICYYGFIMKALEILYTSKTSNKEVFVSK